MKAALRSERLRSIAAACAVALGLVAAFAAWADYDEYKVKAAFLLNFARLVEWPAAAAPAPGAPLVVGVYEQGHMAADAMRALSDTSVDDHPVEVRALDAASEAEGCHILYLTGEGDAEVAAWLRAGQRHSVLTVGESEGFASRGGIINFFVEGNKLRFEINKDAADRSGLKISSRLLRLARLVPDAD